MPYRVLNRNIPLCGSEVLSRAVLLSSMATLAARGKTIKQTTCACSSQPCTGLKSEAIIEATVRPNTTKPTPIRPWPAFSHFTSWFKSTLHMTTLLMTRCLPLTKLSPITTPCSVTYLSIRVIPTFLSRDDPDPVIRGRSWQVA